jgi:hypothetical protein
MSEQKDNKEIIEGIVASVKYLLEYGESLDVAIEKSLDYEINFAFAGENSWQRTTGNRWGVTAEQVKAALDKAN